MVDGGKQLRIEGVREHNLGGFDLELPHDALIVIHGVSGSGKSSLAFDTIFREGQRRYLRTLSAHTRQMVGRLPKPSLKQMTGVRAALAIDQRSVVRSPRSTVGTLTEVAAELRLLFARFGDRHCPECGEGVEGKAPERGKAAHCPCGTQIEPLTRSTFSFNTEEGACPSCRGLGVEDAVDPALLIADPAKTLREGALVPTTPNGYIVYSQVTPEAMNTVCAAHGFDIDTPWCELSAAQQSVILWGSDRVEVPFGKHSLESRMKWSGIKAKPREMGHYRGIARVISETLVRDRNENVLRFARSQPCSECAGSRLAATPRAVRLAGKSIGDFLALSLSAIGPELSERLRSTPYGAEAAGVTRRIAERAERMDRLGLGHLALDRGAATLSAGEARRLRLATQLGIDLRGLTIVFDEPSAGAHAVEREHIAALLQATRDRGNTVILVEHDPAFRRVADHLVEIGPGAGTHGGQLVYEGPPRKADLEPSQISLATAGRREASGWIRVRGARARNLRGIDADFGIGILNVVSGVSGAGKSTLVDRVLARALAKQLHRSRAVPGEYDAIEGCAGIDRIVLVDQSEIGRSPRSNPATYSGAFDAIRTLFAATPEAKERGLGKGAFSFNKKGGRCERCEGAGVEVVGLMSLPAVSIICAACEGRRFSPEVLQVRVEGWSILDTLEGTIEEARAVFSGQRKIVRILDSLLSAGLGYLRLGQPATTLSGGEAQRLKLATELARESGAGSVIILDEPTSGLHPRDVQVVLAALRALVERGVTIIAVEHELSFIAAADHIIDLGPGAGADGGCVVASGSLQAIMNQASSRTGQALLAATNGAPLPNLEDRSPPKDEPIRLRGVHTRNLEQVDASFRPGELTVVTGVSGSGKTSLAFDTLATEGRRRFAESLSPHLRRDLIASSVAKIEEASGLRPTIAIRSAGRGASAWSTVGTVTGADAILRLLFARAATAPCPHCDTPTRPGHCPCGQDPREEWTASHFSARSPLGACPRCDGRGIVPCGQVDRLIDDPACSISAGALATTRAGKHLMEVEGRHHATLLTAAAIHGVDLDHPWTDLGPAAQALVREGTGDEVHDVIWEHARAKGEANHRFQASWPGVAALLEEEYEKKRERKIGAILATALHDGPCTTCAGERLSPEQRRAAVGAWSIRDFGALTMTELLALCRTPASLAERADPSDRQLALFEGLAQEIIPCIERLPRLGLGYLALDRRTTSLSTGERRRLEIAAQLVEGLRDAAYIIDEPCLGLHSADREPLADALRDLASAGNTVVVVEHDEALIRAADQLLEIGPGAGAEGGHLINSGSPDQVLAQPSSPTGHALAQPIHPRSQPRSAPLPLMRIAEACANNLKGFDLEVRSSELLMICGVSGSGKSTLVGKVLAPTLATKRATDCKSFRLEHADTSLIRVEGRPLGTGPASLVATAINLMAPLRTLFARSQQAKAQGIKGTAFTALGKSGSCPTCRGTGERRIALDFIPDAVGRCRTCDGQRFRPEVLACKVEGYSIAQLLECTARELSVLLPKTPLAASLTLLEDVGLAHLPIGRRCDSLSTGETQRLAIARDLLAPSKPKTAAPSLYIFDEPSRGLHAADLPPLVRIFDRLVAAGHAVVVVEHSLRLLAGADRILELGPAATNAGGQVIFEGSPQALAAATTPTGKALALRAASAPPY